MNITFRDPGGDHSVESISLFLSGSETPFWSEPILHFYPQLDRHMLTRLEGSQKQEYLKDALSAVYESKREEIRGKVTSYNAHFQAHKGQIEAALSDAFDLDAGAVFNDLTSNVTLNPICPRFLKERYFDLFYLSSERGALGLSLHEVIHYFWFHVWNGHFGDSYDEYETPSLKWILSEAVVEAIMSDERLSSLNPYFPKENGGCVYPYFQSMVLDGVPMLHTLDKLYRGCSITGFMEEAYAYFSRYESDIRRHIEQAENSF